MNEYSNQFARKDYWLDFPRQEIVDMKEEGLTKKQREKVSNGETVYKQVGGYTNYYYPTKKHPLEK